VTFVDRPFMGFMLEWLARHGVDDVIMSCGFLATKVKAVLGDGSRFGVRLRFVEEPEPRGTAGALKYAEDLLQDRFLMLNGDVLTDVDVTAQLAQHEATGARGTLGLVPVEDPSAYGLVLMRDGGEVTGFLEKPDPDELEGVEEDLISAGIYVPGPHVLDLIEPDRNVSIEREIWPRARGDGLYGFADRAAYWMDIGTPQRYLQGTADILLGHVQTSVGRAPGRSPPGPCPRGALAEGAQGHPGPADRPGPAARLGRGARRSSAPAFVGANVHDRLARASWSAPLSSSARRSGAGAHAARRGSGARVSVGERTIVQGRGVLGERVSVGADCKLDHGIKVFRGRACRRGRALLKSPARAAARRASRAWHTSAAWGP
jgi:mannose-1-phosphate guanylyltransferase